MTKKISELNILASLALGINPLTGEVLQKDHFINDPSVSLALSEVAPLI